MNFSTWQLSSQKMLIEIVGTKCIISRIGLCMLCIYFRHIGGAAAVAAQELWRFGGRRCTWLSFLRQFNADIFASSTDFNSPRRVVAHCFIRNPKLSKLSLQWVEASCKCYRRPKVANKTKQREITPTMFQDIIQIWENIASLRHKYLLQYFRLCMCY